MKINVVVEGASDQEAARAVVTTAGAEVERLIVKNGKRKLDPDLGKYNRAARQGPPWVVFRDSDSVCPVTLHRQLTNTLGTIAPQFLLRIAHSMTEAWLLADQESFGEFFGVSKARIPRDVETLQDAKRSLLSLCQASRSRAIKRDMVTVSGETGPLYVNRLNEYASQAWRPAVAAEISPSLRRAICRITLFSG